MSLRDKRQIMTKSFVGKQHIKELLSGMLMGEILNPGEMWLVSAWVSDFELLDNRWGSWDLLNPSWGHRMVTFFEMLETAVSNGCQLKVVVKKHETNINSIIELNKRLARFATYRLEETPELHTKGLLTKHAFLGGSMNFTYSGTNRNEEMMIFDRDPNVLSNTGLEFSSSYMLAPKEDLFSSLPTIQHGVGASRELNSDNTSWSQDGDLATLSDNESIKNTLSQDSEDDDDCLF